MDHTQRRDFAPTDVAARLEPPVQEAVARRIWENYFHEVQRQARPLPKAQQRELILELYGHLQASMASGTVEREAERVLDALDKLGSPSEYVKPLVADRMLEEAAHSFNPITIAKGLGLSVFRGAAYAFAAVGFFVGYLMSFALMGVALLKPFFPDEVGAYTHPGGLSVGFISESMHAQAVEHLGFAIIPVGLILGGVLYMGLTKLLRLLKSQRNAL